MSSSDAKLTDFKVLVFDVYATLVDWETGIYTALQPLLSGFPASSRWSRKEAIFAFTSVEKDLQAQHPQMLYSELLAKAHEVLEARLRASAGKESSTTTLEGDPSTTPNPAAASTSAPTPPPSNSHTTFAESIKNWPLCPDTFHALQTLARHYKLIVLSNVDRASFAHTHAQLSEGPTTPLSPTYSYPNPNPHQYWSPQTVPGSKSPFSLILTAQDTLGYKPSPEPFTAALTCVWKDPTIDFPPTESRDDVKGRVLMVAQSLYHDIVPASRLGLKSVWIDRQGACMGLETDGDAHASGWTWRFETLGEMAEAVAKEFADLQG